MTRLWLQHQHLGLRKFKNGNKGINGIWRTTEVVSENSSLGLLIFSVTEQNKCSHTSNKTVLCLLPIHSKLVLIPIDENEQRQQLLASNLHCNKFWAICGWKSENAVKRSWYQQIDEYRVDIVNAFVAGIAWVKPA